MLSFISMVSKRKKFGGIFSLIWCYICKLSIISLFSELRKMTESYLPDKKSPNYHLYPWYLNWGRLAKSYLQPRNPYSLNWKKIYDQVLSPSWETISELPFISLVPDEKTDCHISKWKLCLRYLSYHWCLEWGEMDKSIFELSLYLIKLSFYRWCLSGRKFGKSLLPCWNFISELSFKLLFSQPTKSD